MCVRLWIVRLLLTDPRLCYEVYTNIVTSHQFRLVGPRAWSGARPAVLGITERLHYPVITGIPQRLHHIEVDERMQRKLFLLLGLLAIVGCYLLAVAPI